MSMKILLIKQTSLGDVLHMTPLLRALKKCYSECEIDVVTDKRALSILENNPYINKLYVLDIYRYERDMFKSPYYFFSVASEFFSHIKKVRKNKYDIVIDLQGLERSVIFLYFAKSKKKYAKGKWLFVKSNYYKDVNAIHGLMSFLDFLGCSSDGTHLDFFLPSDIENKFNKKLSDSNVSIAKEYIVVSPFSRWITKDLPIEKTKEIISFIRKKSNMQIIISATNDYKDDVESILKGSDNVVSLAGTLDIETLAYLIKNAYGMIAVDSFPMHIASAYNTPLIALFGATSEKRVGPLSENSSVIRVENLPCAMCYLRKNCTNESKYKCMNDLDSEIIVSTLFNFIANS